MEASHSLLLNEEALKSCAEQKRALFVYEWLRYLERILPATQKSDLRSVQKALMGQLESRLGAGPGPSTRVLLARCIARVYSVGDTSSLFATLNLCNDRLKAKDDSPQALSAKLAALACLGALYETVGRLVGRSYEDTFHIITKWLKTAESQGRSEMMQTLAKMVSGLGSAASTVHREIYKTARACAVDRNLAVRAAAIECLISLVPEYAPLYTTDIEGICTQCVKALDGSNHEIRLCVARLLSALLCAAHQPHTLIGAGRRAPAPSSSKSGSSSPAPLSVEDCFQLLSSAFLRGGVGGFLKGGSSNQASAGGLKEVRVGIAMAYVEFIRSCGARWLERSSGVLSKHVLALAAKCGTLAYTNSSAQQSEAVLMRSCLSFILRSTLGAMLGEAAQLAAAKQLGVLLAEHINSFDYVTDSGIEGVLGTDAHSSGQAAIVAVLELSSLVKQIGTAVTPLFVEASGITEPIFACLIHPVTAARVATAWCLRCCTIAVPGLLTPLIDRCINRLEHMKTSGEAISGYSLALAALIAGSKDCQLGVPHGKPKQVLSAAEDLLRTAAQSSRLAVAKMSAGWVLLHALVSLGPAVVKPYLPRIIALWRAAFPRSAKEAENEKMRGDAFSWECALINRTGALSVMEAVAAQKELMDDDAIKAMQLPIECSLVVMAAVGGLVRSYGTKMRKQIAALRVRLYGLLGHLNAKCYEGVFSSLLRELVADITLSDNTQSAQATSLAGASCGSCLSVLAPWHNASDEAVLENGLNAAATTVGGAIENDVTELISGSGSSAGAPPDPQLPTVASLDGAIVIYGKIFPLLPNKHRLQITEHCVETMKNAKPSARQQAIQLNVLCALVAAYKNGGATSSSGSSTAAAAALEQLRTTTINLIMSALSSPSSIIRAVGAEALGRLAQAVNDPLFVASVAQQCFNVLQSSRDALTRSGVVLALGCLHRHVGSLGSGQYLNTGVKIALSLAQDTASPMVQSWALLSLSLIAETGGGMFAGYVEPMLTTCVSLLLSTPSHCTEVTLSVGKLLSALLTCVGPELGVSGTASGVETMRSCLLAACALLLSHEHAVVRAEGVAGLQQMHLFAPRHVHLGTLVIDIASLLTSRFISLRRASVSCLRQLVQREAREVREHAQALVPQGVLDEAKKLPLPETGLEGALFGMLDAETDRVLRAHVEETVISLVQATCGTHLAHWLALCKEVLATSIADSAAAAGPAAGAAMGEKGGEKDDEEDGGDDDMQLHAGSGRPGVEEKQKLAARWPTRVFACQIVRRLMAVCESERAHLDLALAKELQLSSGGRADYLVLHLSDLVRMSFMGATSDNTQLRLAGLHCLQDVIARFSAVPEPEFPGHVLLEQFQAQVGAALRPAFTEDTPSDVTAAACQVCSTWISSKVARDLNDLRRVNQLLVSSLSKLKHGSINTQLYSESAATLEKLAILKAWAEVYITAVEQKQEAEEESKRRGSGGRMNGNDDPYSQSGGGACLLSLVEPELADLVGYWLAALKDSALLALPSSFSDQLPPEGGAFYKAERAEACREYYRSSWPPILLAASIWLRDHNFVLPGTSDESLPLHCSSSLSSLPSRLFLMIGVALDSLCSRTSTADDTTTHCALRALSSLMSSDEARLELMRDVSVPVEIVNVLHRLVLTRDNLATQQLCVDCAAAVMDAAMCCKAIGGGTENSDAINGNIDSAEAEKMKGLYQCDDGGESGELKPGMLSYAFMEFILAVVVRQLPQVNSAAMRSRSSAPLHTRRVSRLPPEAAALCKGAVQLMVQIPSLCSPSARLTLLPVSLHLITAFIRESARLDDSSIVPDLPPGHLTLVATAALQGLRSLASSAPPQSEERNYARWALLMRSALLTILNIPTANSAHTYDECVVLLAAAILSSASPREVAVGHRESVEKLCVLAKHQLRRNEPQVVCKCLQALTSLFSRKDLAAVYARRLAPAVVEVLRPYVLEDDAETAVKEICEDGVAVVGDAVKALEALIPAVAERNRLSVVSLISQSLTRLLYASRADEWRALSPQARKLHETALARLTALAPAYPLEFKQVLAAHPDAKRRLEAQLLFQSTRATHQAQAIAIKAAAVEHAKAASSSAQPSIKLTMDFNAFGKA